MKRVFILISIVLPLMLLASCEESRGHGSLRINLENDSPRSILPDDFSLEIASYRITGKGPAGAVLDITTSKTSTTVDGLMIGEWELNATALNEDGIPLVEGSTTVRITGRNTSATIYLDELIGKGDITLNLSWDAEVLSEDPRIEVEFEPEYGDMEIEALTEHSIDIAGGRAVYKGTGYPSGSFRLSARLYEGEKDVPLAGFTEAVRIADGQESIGNIEFDLDKFPSEPSTIELVNITGVPVQLTITGLNDTVTADVPVTVSLTSDSDIGSFQISWHLDGGYLGEGESIELIPTVGTHRLDAIASTSRTGSTGSASFNFEAISKAATGAPNQGNVMYAPDDGIDMGLGMVVEFLPDGEVMIASNSAKVLQICSVVRSSLVVEHVYSYDELGLGSGQTIAAIAAGEKTTKEHRIFMLMDSPLEAAVYVYSPETRAMSLSVKGMTDDDICGEGTPVHALFAGINMDRNVGIAVLGEATRTYASAFLFDLEASTTSAFKDTVQRDFQETFCEGFPTVFDYDDTMIVGGETMYFGLYTERGGNTPYDLSSTPLAFNEDAAEILRNMNGVAILRSLAEMHIEAARVPAGRAHRLPGQALCLYGEQR